MNQTGMLLGNMGFLGFIILLCFDVTDSPYLNCQNYYKHIPFAVIKFS